MKRRHSFTIRMSHWHLQMVDGTEFWICCKWLAFLITFSRLQVIQNLAPSTISWYQCDIRITRPSKACTQDSECLGLHYKIPISSFYKSKIPTQDVTAYIAINQCHLFSRVRTSWEVSDGDENLIQVKDCLHSQSKTAAHWSNSKFCGF